MPTKRKADSRRRQVRLAAVVAAATVAVAIAVAFGSGGASDQPPRNPEAVAAHGAHGTAAAAMLLDGIPQDGTQLGRADAPVTLVEFADLQCPYCRELAVGVLPAIVEHYVRPGRVRIDLRLLRFIGEDSRRAAGVAAAAAAQDRLWNFTDLFYRNQGAENSGYATDRFLHAIATGAGVDADRALSARDGEPAERLLAAAEVDAKRAGVASTPTLLAGPTGGKLRPLRLSSLDGSELHAALDALLEHEAAH